MKKILLFFLFFPLALAIHGGETEKIVTLSCTKNYTVKVTGASSIDVGEYRFINCSEHSPNIWDCDCNTNNLVMALHTGAVNTYNLLIEYSYLGESYSPSEDKSSGGSSYSIKKNITVKNETKTFKKPEDNGGVGINLPSPPEAILPISFPPDNKSKPPEKPEMTNMNQIIVSGLAVIILILIASSVYSFLKTRKKGGGQGGIPDS